MGNVREPGAMVVVLLAMACSRGPAGAYRVATVSGARTDPNWSPPQGYMNVNLGRFACGLKPGTTEPAVYNCSSAGVEEVLCEYGSGTIDLPLYLDRSVPEYDGRDLSVERPLAIATWRKMTHFVTDRFGHAYYFGEMDGRWWLLAVNTTDCSA